MCYQSSSTSHGLLLTPANLSHKFSLRAYSESDWPSDLDDTRSISKSCIFFLPNLFWWSSKKKSFVSRSSTEEEYRSLAHTTSELRWIKSLLNELVEPFHPLSLLCDNLSIILFSHNYILHAREEHIELDILLFAKELLQRE